jgi:ubiquinone/menaquinone biosynthesis C-methylase UbiE
MPFSSAYALGYSSFELDRLRRQAARLQRISRRFFRDAGICAGMRVLELGSGLGDATQLLAEMVGPAGEIVSIDRSPIMLQRARASLQERGAANVQFIEGDLNILCMDVNGSFDAVAGRLILTHLDDPAATLSVAVEQLRSGGVVAFQEADSTLSDSLLSLHKEKLRLTCQVCEWIKLARRGTSMNPQMGLQMHQVFQQAGLSAPAIYFHTELYSGASALRIQNTVAMVRELSPRLESLGVCPGDIGIGTLEERLNAELAAADVVQAFASIASAWAVSHA